MVRQRAQTGFLMESAEFVRRRETGFLNFCLRFSRLSYKIRFTAGLFKKRRSNVWLCRLSFTPACGTMNHQEDDVMAIKQADLFWGFNQNFVSEIMAVAVKDSYSEGEVLFYEGAPATDFFILIQGQVKLVTGEVGESVYTISQVGETFGWSSLIGRSEYSATAICSSSTVLLKLDSKQISAIIEKDAENGLLFFKRLAGALGNRLLRCYQLLSSRRQKDPSCN